MEEPGIRNSTCPRTTLECVLLEIWLCRPRNTNDLAQQTMKSRTWRNFQPFKKGAKVWLEGRNLKRSLPNPKFAAKREGPFTITEVLSPVTYKLRLPQSWKIHNTFHTSLLSPYHENEIHGQNFPSPPPDLIDNEEHYKIKWIIHHKGILS